jgi:hypothetical protein
MPPPSRRRRGDLAIGGVPFGSFLGETKSAQPRRFKGFDLLRILVGELRLHMYVFCHHGNGIVLWGGIYDVAKLRSGNGRFAPAGPASGKLLRGLAYIWDVAGRYAPASRWASLYTMRSCRWSSIDTASCSILDPSPS